MNKNNNTTKDFFKKEGFYVILFVCLCVVATVAAISSRSPKKVAVNKPPIAKNQQVKVNTNDKSTVKENNPKPKDSLQVNNNIDKSKYKYLPQVPKKSSLRNNANKGVAVSNINNIEFIKPIENGTLGRSYSEETVYWKSTSDESKKMKNYRPNWGIDIATKIDTPVLAVCDGKVEDVGVTNEGVYVQISHEGEIKTKYCNLNEKVAVKKGDSVKQGDVIGKVGNTTKNSAYEDYGPHLHYEITKDGKHIDPARYAEYKSEKNNIKKSN